MKILIGLDAEFMALKRGRFAFPLIEPGRLSGFGCDEMGHCLEARPEAAHSARGLVFNTMKALSELPTGYKYTPENMITIPKEDYFKLLKIQGGKEVPKCINVYNKDILDDGDAGSASVEYDRSLHRVLFCGMHVHVSAYKKVEYEQWDDSKKCSVPQTQKVFIDLPKITLVKLFDEYIFDALKNDPGFVSGRYRQPGFYEDKTHGGFEYRSLGSTALTPKRVAIIFDMVKMIVENCDVLANIGCSDSSKDSEARTALSKLKTRLSKTRPPTNLLRAWVTWK